MERVGLKRMRSEEDPYSVQTKMYVNEKLIDLNNPNKMKFIHDKTKNLLFQASRVINSNKMQTEQSNKVPLCSLVVLLGNGVIEPAKDADDYGEEFMWVKNKAKCCPRETYLQSDCTNCQKPLCEECGYSCQECGHFICNSCVTVFGSGNADHPICESCLLFA